MQFRRLPVLPGKQRTTSSPARRDNRARLGPMHDETGTAYRRAKVDTNTR
jgi:hypothetical protein